MYAGKLSQSGKITKVFSLDQSLLCMVYPKLRLNVICPKFYLLFLPIFFIFYSILSPLIPALFFTFLFRHNDDYYMKLIKNMSYLFLELTLFFHVHHYYCSIPNNINYSACKDPIIPELFYH